MQDKNVDLFFGTMLDASLKDDRALMEYPFFSLEKRPVMTKLVYKDGRDRRVRIEISPGEKGIATIWDKDVLIYCASYINECLEKGLPVDRTIRVSTYDILRTTGRGVGKTDYDKLYDALYRLRSTTIVTDIESDGQRERHGFGWLDNFSILERVVNGRKVAVGLELTLNKWMFRALVKDRRVLTINRAYFGLTMGLERRLYELARKHCGAQQEWRIGLDRLREKCGTKSSLRHFKSYVREIIGRGSIPDYDLTLINDHSGPVAQSLRSAGAAHAERGASRRKNDLVIVVVQPKARAVA